MKENLKNKKGITLIALVITIIVLLILAGVSIATLTGENGLIQQATVAKENTEIAGSEEKINLLLQEAYINEYEEGTDKIEYVKSELLKMGAEKVWNTESYQKEYWKYEDTIVIIYPNKYSVNNIKNTLVNNEGNNDEKGFLIDISDGGIPRKDIESITIENKIPEGYSVSYDVSEARDESLMLYANKNENNKYDITIAAKNNQMVNAPAYSARLFGDLTSLKKIDLKNLNMENVTSMYVMFSNSKTLEEINLNGMNTSNVKDMTNLFYNCNNLKKVNLEGIDTSNVTSMQGMFSKCNKLVEINLKGLDTSNVTNMTSMFSECSSLTDLDLSHFNTSKTKTMNSMFNSCRQLQTLDISNFNTSNVTTMKTMFMYCENLTELNLKSFDTKKVTNMESMFSDCINLSVIYASENWDTSKATTTSMFYKCGTDSVEII